MLEPSVPIAETDIDTWCRVWDVNVKVAPVSVCTDSRGRIYQLDTSSRSLRSKAKLLSTRPQSELC